MSNVGHIPPGGGPHGLMPDLKPAQLRRQPVQQETQRPVTPPAKTVQDGVALSSRQSLSNAAAYARGAAQVLPKGDPLKGFAKGLSDDLAGARGETFASAGRLGALHNAHSFALASNMALQNSAALKPLQ